MVRRCKHPDMTKKIVMMFLVILLVFASFCGQAYADKDIDDKKDERDKTQEELDEVEASIEELAAEQEGIEEEIEEVSCALVQILAEIDVIEAQMAEKQVQIDQAVIDYNAAVELEKQQYEAMKIRIKYLYENGDTNILNIFMESGSITETLTKAEYVEDLYDYDRKMLSEYQNTVETVKQLHEKLLEEQEELEALKQDYEAQQASMEEVVAELQSVADDYGSQIASAKAKAAEYAKQIEAQNAEIARLEEEARKKAEEEAARKKAEEEAKRKAEEARAKASSEVADSQDTGVVKTTSSSNIDVSSIYSTSGSDVGKSIAAYACQFIGNPYVAGGTSLTNGADCSGFVFSVYKDFGYSVPRTSYSLRNYGTEVSLEEAQPGDVVCYPGHVGIYIGNGMIVHASTERTGIKVSNANYRGISSIRRIAQ